MSDLAPSRRTVLAGLAGLVGAGVLSLGACSTRAPDPAPPRPDPDTAVLSAVAEAVGRLAAAYTATAARHPSLRGRLAPLAAEHTAHLAALDRSRPTPSASAATAVPSVSTPPAVPAVPAVPTVPASPRAALVALATAERANADQRVRDLATASPSLARLVAAIGAAEAAHAALLGRAA